MAEGRRTSARGSIFPFLSRRRRPRRPDPTSDDEGFHFLLLLWVGVGDCQGRFRHALRSSPSSPSSLPRRGRTLWHPRGSHGRKRGDGDEKTVSPAITAAGAGGNAPRNESCNLDARGRGRPYEMRPPFLAYSYLVCARNLIKFLACGIGEERERRRLRP